MTWAQYIGEFMSADGLEELEILESQYPFDDENADEDNFHEGDSSDCCDEGCLARIGDWKLFRNAFKDLEKEERRLVLAGIMMHANQRSPSVARSARLSFEYRLYADESVCRIAFTKIFEISDYTLKTLSQMVQHKLYRWPLHRAVGKPAHNRLDPHLTDKLQTFINNMLEIYALPSPKCMKMENEVVLPKSITLFDLWSRFSTAMEDICQTATSSVSYDYFRHFFRDAFPHVQFQGSRTDLCDFCDEKREALSHVRNREQLTKISAALTSHLDKVEEARVEYKAQVRAAKSNWLDIRKNIRTDLLANLSNHPNYKVQKPNRRNINIHYSWDFAQQIHYPYSPQQRGQEYFKTARKCSIFGVSCEHIGRSVLFLQDEDEFVGKGANTIISYAHAFFMYHGLGEKHAFLHMDNCPGQNKNSYVFQYLIWRVMQRLHTSITVTFMPVGHTKFWPDSTFGQVKLQYQKHNVDSLMEVIECARKASREGLIVPHVYGKHIGLSNRYIVFSNWSDYLGEFFKKVPRVKEVEKINFSAEKTGIAQILYKGSNDWTDISMLKRPNQKIAGEPDKIIPKGLTNERKEYLYNEIRKFVRNPKRRSQVAPHPGRS